MRDQPLVAVIFPVHNNKQDTKEFLESLKGGTYPNYRIIIIDDGSTDGTEEMIKKEYPEVFLLKGDGNLWWTLSMNMGIEKAIEIGADYILIADNDSKVSSDFLSALVDTVERNPRSITFSKVYCYEEPERIYSAGWTTNWLWGGLKRIGTRELDKGQYDVQRNCKAANVNMLINTAFFQDLGMFDHKNFPQYWSDTDFTYRAYKKGYRIIYEPKSVIWNKGQGTTGPKIPQTASLLKAFTYYATNKRSSRTIHDSTIFYWRHYPRILFPYMVVQNIVRQFIASLLLCGRHIIKQLRGKILPG